METRRERADRTALSKRHRSFRAAPFFPSAIFTSLAASAVLTAVFCRYGREVLQFHESLRATLLSWAGVPISAVMPTVAISGFEVRIPLNPVASYNGRPWLPWVVFAILAAVMSAIYAKVELTRGVVVFGVTLLFASAVYASVHPAGPVDTVLYVPFWLQCEFVVWTLLPWVVSLLTAFIVPSFWARLAWTIMTPAYGIVWSAVRLTFCAGILYLTGPAFDVFLWFSLGLLADVLFLCAFYSFAVYQAVPRQQRER